MGTKLAVSDPEMEAEICLGGRNKEGAWTHHATWLTWCGLLREKYVFS